MPKVCITLPVYNEATVLEKNTLAVLNEISKIYNNFEIIIADNASTDATLEIAKKLEKKNSKIHIVHLNKKGRGRALKNAWMKSKSDIVSYMDIDLSTNIKHLSRLIEAITIDGYDVAIGSRLLNQSKVKGRPLIREVFSRAYNLLIRLMFLTNFHDAQCGFKAIRKDVFMKLLPRIKDNAWFFDSELLIIAEKSGFKIKEVPVEWKDDPSSTVKVLKTSWDDLKGLIRLMIARPWKD